MEPQIRHPRESWEIMSPDIQPPEWWNQTCQELQGIANIRYHAFHEFLGQYWLRPSL